MDCPIKVLLPKRIAFTSCPFRNGQVEILGRTSDWSRLGPSTPWEGKVERLDRPSSGSQVTPEFCCLKKRKQTAQPKGADACCGRGHVRAISHLM